MGTWHSLLFVLLKTRYARSALETRCSADTATVGSLVKRAGHVILPRHRMTIYPALRPAVGPAAGLRRLSHVAVDDARW